MPDPADFARLDRLLDEALDQPPAERVEWIARACGPDAALRRQLERLLALAQSDDPQLAPGGALRGAVWEQVARELEEERPPLRNGDTVGRYEVRGLLGGGGMGQVYRVFDATLGREVALKALARSFSEQDTERRRRFEREARILATLNHPNIAAIHGFERIDGAPFLVLELVEGPTLAERLARGPLLIDEAVAAGLQIAAAVEEAHARGVVHRDLKPSNIKLGLEGRVKVLDFGIAKSVTPARHAVEESGPVAAPERDVTTRGVVLGTAPYMSPEQIRGDDVDPRTDVWSFGCVLYEMLTGQPAFVGGSAAEVMASVLRDDVEWTRLPADTPPALRRLLRRCLRRDPRRRLQSMGDVRLELSELEDEGVAPASRPGPRPRGLWPLAVLAAAFSVAIALAFSGARVPPAPVTRLSLELPAGLAVADDFACPFAISPDGSRVVVRARRDDAQRLFLRELARPDAVPIAGSEGGWQPFFSADGRQLAFFADRKLKRVALDGGQPVLPIAEIGRNPRGGCWAGERSLVVAPSARSGLVRVDVASGTLTPLTHLEASRGEGSHRWPQLLPGDQWVLFTASTTETTFDEARIEAVSLAAGQRKVLLTAASHGRYAEGRLFFTRAGRVFAVPFEPHTMTVQGAPEVVLEGVRYDVRSGATDFALSEQGTLVYRSAPPTSTDTYLAWVDADGALTRIGEARRPFREPKLSPDAKRVAVRVGTEADSELWIVETESGTFAPVSLGRGLHRPVWTPDGRAVTVASRDADGWKLLTFPAAGGAPVLTYAGPHRLFANAWSADGRRLVFQELRPDTSWDLRVLDVGADGTAQGAPRDLAAMPFQERNAALSPDGRWVAYEADEPDDLAEIYVVSTEKPAVKVRATFSSGRWPHWGREGELYYWFPTGRPLESSAAAGLNRIDWRLEDGRLVVAGTTPLWRGTAATGPLDRLVVTPYASFDVDLSRPQPRFLALDGRTGNGEAPLQHPVVILNWFADLRARPR